ncbi:thermonuclease family protein (plasmid) [Rhizobium sp. T136]|uniref:Rcorf73 n=2 Tax=Rhizobium/Agrobacterium group TaxID=227290 RepID=W6RJ52_9HYPH|nr:MULTISPECIES: thermonuclease family protein [Rhizobium]MCS0462244.1 thermonuclease family protein [Rhizobium favelukesii]UFS84611.1 thermonuclease family protein [Rhizobium sp. T136]CDM60335.1 rcorf73 [Rhizobium favelukesii]
MAQKNVIPFRKNRKLANDRRGTNSSRSTSRRHRPDRGRGIPITMIWAAMVIGAAGWLYLYHNGHLDSAVFAKAHAQDALSASFVLCGDSQRTNCVVDGDTFWFEGEKIRIADIDTPELSPPRCEAERIRGEAAKSRLLSLLNAGKFSLSAGLRDEDKYGRKLRTVSRAGTSLGDALVDEGSARSWDGTRHGWCQGG